MKRLIIIFCFLQIQMMAYSQEWVHRNVNLLIVENQNFFDVMGTIINYERNNFYGGITESRSYLIDYTIYYDTTVTVTSIYPIDFDTSLFQSIYGVFVHQSHFIFVKRKFNDNFIMSDSTIAFKVQEYLPEIGITDDSETIWTFLMKEGKLIYRNSKGINLRENRHVIEIIEEEVDDFPVEIKKKE